MNNFVDPETKVVCPYNPNHTCFIARFAFHLTKCRKSYTGTEMKICDFNNDHVIPKPEEEYHKANCPDRFAHQAREAVLKNDDDEVPTYPIKNIITSLDAEWDEEELDHPGYDGERNTEHRNVLRSYAVELPSTMKQFRRDEQRRMNTIRAPTTSNASIPQESVSSTSRNVPKNDAPHIDEEKPELSLADRISNDRTVYTPRDPNEGFEFPKSRKNRKNN